MGLNANSWCTNHRKEKILQVHEFLDQHKPDVLIILETACSERAKLIVPHDDYHHIHNPIKLTEGSDEGSALGRGTAIIYKKHLIADKISQELNGDHVCAIRLKTKSLNMIIIGFHANHPRDGREKLQKILT